MSLDKQVPSTRPLTRVLASTYSTPEQITELFKGTDVLSDHIPHVGAVKTWRLLLEGAIRNSKLDPLVDCLIADDGTAPYREALTEWYEEVKYVVLEEPPPEPIKVPSPYGPRRVLLEMVDPTQVPDYLKHVRVIAGHFVTATIEPAYVELLSEDENIRSFEFGQQLRPL